MQLQRYLSDATVPHLNVSTVQIQSSKDNFLLFRKKSFDFLFLDTKGSHTFSLFLDEGLVELEDNSDSQQNTSTRTNGTHKVSNDGEGSNTHTTKGSSGRDVSVEDMNKGRITVSLHDHLVVTELLSDIPSRSSRDLNPGLTEESTSSQDENKVENGMERIVDDFSKGHGRRDVVGNSSDGDLLSCASLNLLPLSKKTNQNIGWSTVVQELRDKVQVGN